MRKPVVVGNFEFRFECVGGCTACCTRSGHVYVTGEDAHSASKYLKISELEFVQMYCEQVGGEMRLSNPLDVDCHFLEENGCSIHHAKPLQCRTFPYWPELVDRKRNWKSAARFCPGIGEGPLVQIEQVRAQAEACGDAFPKF